MKEDMYFVKVLLIGEVESIINIKQIEVIKKDDVFATIWLRSGKVVNTVNEYGDVINRIQALYDKEDEK